MDERAAKADEVGNSDHRRVRASEGRGGGDEDDVPGDRAGAVGDDEGDEKKTGLKPMLLEPPARTSTCSEGGVSSIGDWTNPPDGAVGVDGKASLSSSSAGLGGMKPSEGGSETWREGGRARCDEVERVRARRCGAVEEGEGGGREMRRSSLLGEAEVERAARDAEGSVRWMVARALMRAAFALRTASSQMSRSSRVSVPS